MKRDGNPQTDTATRDDATRDRAGNRAVTVVHLGDVKLAVVAMDLEVPLPELTAAEREVAQLAVDGCSNREIAERRGTSVKTVANQLRGIYEKLDINSRFELAARFR